MWLFYFPKFYDDVPPSYEALFTTEAEAEAYKSDNNYAGGCIVFVPMMAWPSTRSYEP